MKRLKDSNIRLLLISVALPFMGANAGRPFFDSTGSQQGFQLGYDEHFLLREYRRDPNCGKPFLRRLPGAGEKHPVIGVFTKFCP